MYYASFKCKDTNANSRKAIPGSIASLAFLIPIPLLAACKDDGSNINPQTFQKLIITENGVIGEDSNASSVNENQINNLATSGGAAYVFQ